MTRKQTVDVPRRYPLLDSIDSPRDLKRLPRSRLSALAGEVRQYLLESVSRSGGHLGAGLGSVELTVALHYVFDTPDDRLVWDVGHQAYPHKILTGRRGRLPSIRQTDGLAPFPSRSESDYDAFGVGHSSTSISAALGMTIAARKRGDRRQVVAIIGDGGMTAGMAYEALNHAGDIDADMLVILNDNEMSISPNVGALHKYLTRILSGSTAHRMRAHGREVLRHIPPVLDLARRTESQLKALVTPGSLFEELGFRYFGPIDGHDLDAMVDTLTNLRNQKGPRLLHLVTRKGKGYGPAEADPVAYHGVGPFDPDQGLQPGAAGGVTYTQVFGDWLCDMAAREARLVAITPAMREGSGLVRFSQEYPDRYFDVAIAEQHAVTVAAGMACEGLKPVVAIYSTFLQRAYDQLIHDVALQKLPVLFAIDRAGLVGPDGPTHAGSFDLSYLRCVPNLVVMAPADEDECRQMLYTGYQLDGPAAVRYPRGKGPGVAVRDEMEAIPVGKAQVRRRGSRVAILAFGAMVEPAEQAAARLDATLVNMRFVKPLDVKLILELAAGHDLLVTVEDNAIAGGAGSAVCECLAAHKVTTPMLVHGLPDEFLEHGARSDLLARCGLDAVGIERLVRAHLPVQDSRQPEVVATAPEESASPVATRR